MCESVFFQALPWLELHHIVVLRDPDTVGGAYTIDFSPQGSGELKTLLMMLLGRNVKGVVRVRWIPGEKPFDSSSLMV